MSEHAIVLRRVSTRAPSGEPILREVSWTIARGAVALVVGPSGSGKSRLLRVVNRLDEVDGGEVEVLGRALDAWSVAELRRRVAWVPQRPSLSAASAGASVELVARLGLITRAELDERLGPALAAVRLDEAVLRRDAAAISGGERHRVALARALVLAPEIILLDEPSSALDGATASGVLGALRAWASAREATLVVVTHRVEDVATLGGEMLVIDDGRAVRTGPSEQLLSDAADYDVRHLLTGRAEGSP